VRINSKLNQCAVTIPPARGQFEVPADFPGSSVPKIRGAFQFLSKGRKNPF
jgi:hypothetical protein